MDGTRLGQLARSVGICGLDVMEARKLFQFAALVALEAASEECKNRDRSDDALRKDAERYRWLRDVGDETWVPMGKRPGINFTHEIDQAIDAAIDKQTRQRA